MPGNPDDVPQEALESEHEEIRVSLDSPRPGIRPDRKPRRVRRRRDVVFAVALVALAGAWTFTLRPQGIGGPAGFAFRSVDLYSSTTTIPYTITGMADGKAAFVLDGELPHTFGNFMTVTNPNPSTVIDKLIIKLTDASFACCGNPMGVDNIALVR